MIFNYEPYQSIGDRLKLLRTVKNYDSDIVAATIEIPHKIYLAVEKNKAEPDFHTIRRLMQLYGCTSDYIIYGIMIGLREKLFQELSDYTRANINAADAPNILARYDKWWIN